MTEISKWTPEMDAQLTKLWTQGETTRSIALQMAWRGVKSHNAVIGRARRIGLPERPSPIKRLAPGEMPLPRKRVRERTVKEHAAPRQGASAKAGGACGSNPPPPPTDGAAKPPAAENFGPSAKIKHQPGCCWPMGEMRSPSFRFCGAAVTKPGAPYCVEHHQRAYRPPVDRRAAAMSSQITEGKSQ